MPATEQTWRNQKLMHRLFAISGLVLLVATIWMFAADSDREWKPIQRTFRQMEVKMSQWEELQANAEFDDKKAGALRQELLVAQSAKPAAELIGKFKDEIAKDAKERAERDGKDVPQAEIDSAHEKIDEAYTEIADSPGGSSSEEKQEALEDNAEKRSELLEVMARFVARARFREEMLADEKKARSGEYDAKRSQLDLAIRDEKPTQDAEKAVQQVLEGPRGLVKLTGWAQDAEDHRKKLQDLLDEVTAAERAVQKKIDEQHADLKAIEAAYKERKATWFTGQYPLLGKKWLELPILDAFGSPLKIDNLWTEGLTHDMYNFKPVTRYDRCTTCHQAMDKTQKGSAVLPKFKPEHEMTFVLKARKEEPKEDGEESEGSKDGDNDEAEEEPSLSEVYGFFLADEGDGLLDRDAVTIAVVAPKSPAAEAKMVPDAEAEDYLTRKELERSLSAALPDKRLEPKFGLAMADVILEVNGSKVLTPGDVNRMLLDSANGEEFRVKIRRGFPHPYVAHPRLDLFVGSLSPHKVEDLGCTVCHDGQGSATSFKWASHYPDSMKQREEWKEEYGWFDNHHWIYPMLPHRFVESSCLKCHHEVTELEPSPRFPEPPAPKLMAGYHDIRRYGCFGCHEINGYDGPDTRVGPDLRLEPNYFAAGLQVAHLASERLDAASTSELGIESNSTAALKEAVVLGNQLGENPDDTAARHRLLELITKDQDASADSAAAIAAGEEADVHDPIFPAVAYELARVLQDDEMAGQYRKVGPSLRYIAAKVGPQFLDDWLRKPKHFRPSTRMPQFFGLHDHVEGAAADEKERAKQTEELKAELRALEEVEVQGIRSYLLKYSQPYEQAEIDNLDDTIASGDAERGKVLFEIGGCLACHSNGDFPDNGDQGPELSQLFEKFTGQEGKRWLYGWIENPKRYHARTKMPVVHLKPLAGNEGGQGEEGEGEEEVATDPIADVVAYLTEGESDWKPKQVNLDKQVLTDLTLAHLEKTFFEAEAAKYVKDGIPESKRSTLKGAEVELLLAEKLVNKKGQLSDEQRLLYVGRKAIGKYGCYACHDIPGFEVAKPIGTALSEWGRKDPLKLDFGHIHHYHGGHGHGHHDGDGHEDDHSHEGDHDHAEHEGHDDDHDHAGHGEKATPTYAPHTEDADAEFFHHELHHGSRIGFIHQKLNEPRSYDYRKFEFGTYKQRLRRYNDRLRMPLFPFNHEQHEEVITFVLGLVAAPPAEEFQYKPTPRQAAVNEGRKVLERFNCAGCHELAAEEWELTLPPDADAIADWRGFREPPPPETFPFLLPKISDEDRAASMKTDGGNRLHATLIGRPRVVDDGDLEAFAHSSEEELFLTMPELEADKFPSEDVAYSFSIWEPALVNGNVYMPKDGLPELPLPIIEHRQPAHGGKLARDLLPRVIKITGQKKGNEAYGWLPPSLKDQGNKTQPDWLHGFLMDPHPIRPAVVMNMPKFNMSSDEATKLVNYFAARDGAEFPYKYESRQRESHLAVLESRYRQAVEMLPPDEKAKFSGDRFADVMKIVTSRAGCIQCHSIGNFDPKKDPFAKGPNLTDVHRRLQPDYVRRWIAKPSYILPYTAMPDNIGYSPQNPEKDGFFDVLPDKTAVRVYHGDSTEQLDALVDLLMNYDKYALKNNDIASLVPEAPVEEGAADDTAASGDGDPSGEANASTDAVDTSPDGDAAEN